MTANKIPEKTLKEIIAYTDHGKLDNMFLYHMLCGEPSEALKIQGVVERSYLFLIADAIKKSVPSKARGRPHAVYAWTKARGLAGLYGIPTKQFKDFKIERKVEENDTID